MKYLKTIFTTTIIIASFILIEGNSYGTNNWEPVGFSGGGLFLQIAVDPTDSSIVYLGADVSGIHKSTDYGVTWTKINSGLGSREIVSFAIDPSNHLRLWVGTPMGLYTSQNGGQSWSLVNADIHCFKHVNYRGITISQDGQTILVASHNLSGETDGHGSGNFSGKLYRSSDGGTNWTLIQQFSGTKIPSVMFDPYTTNQAFLLVDKQGILKSTDGGQNWQDFSSDLPPNLIWKNLDIGQSVIYATAVPTNPYKSGKDSASWQSIRSNIQEDEDTSYPAAGAILVSPADDNTVYLGQAGWPSALYKSTNGGQSWVGSEVPGDYTFDTTNAPHQNWVDPYQAPISIAIDQQNNSRLYYTTWWGVWRSEDGGASWAEKVVGAQNTCCTDVEFSSNKLLSSHMDVGVLSSQNLGTTWLNGIPQSGQGSSFDDFHAWSIEKGADSKIYAGLTTESGPRVYRSDDNGTSWQDKSSGLASTGSFDVLSWISLASDPKNSGTIYLGVDTLLTNGIFRTTNYGDSWTQLTNSPGSGTSTENVLVKCLEVDPTNSNRIFAGLYWDGLWYSEDGGQSWNLASGSGVNLADNSVQMIVALVDGTVFAAYDDGLYKSVDHGHTFSRAFPISSSNLDLGENTVEYVESIAFNPSDTNEIFVSTAKIYPIWYNQGSVWHTKDGGTNWTEITGDLPVKNVVDLTYHNGYLYAATWCANVYRSRISTSIDEGYLVTSDLWIRAVINTVEKGPINAVWQKGGEDTTSAGDRVIWGHFHASPDDVSWGSENNPDLFVKIWFDHGGRLDVNFFHVSVPDIVVCSDYPYDGTPDEQGTTTMSRRYIRQYYESGQSYSDESYEDGNPPSGYSPAGNPSGYSIINDLRIGAIINTVEKGAIDAVWQKGGEDTTTRGDQVVWGHFYANPSDVTWGSQDNPDLFVKIWFDVSGRVDVNFFHVSVPDIEVYSDLPDDSTYDQKGTTVMDNRYIRNEY